MKVLVIGANGQIGTQLVEKLQENATHDVTAMVRKEEQVEKFKKKGIQTVLGDLEDSVDALAERMSDADAVVFAAGSGGKTGFDKTLLIDLDGAIKSVEAAESKKVDRFIMVSAHQAHNRESWNEQIKPYFVAKHYADEFLMASSLNYTILRPGGLTNDAGTGKVELGKNVERGSIPREDVAETAMLALDNESTYRKDFDLISGDSEINVALKNL
ncbi:SDR family oxidoreductase [Saliterribacillus persicus]|uniref:Uncharacterized protein YbjT (DUF2867 family) n=1 Tax=Saliterribacillus persicus TaxID=930114 RepID=A0A368X722_9BACI|nr:SDR family oxidoreductase [Saliterribacillus persicus]RCW63743.1 uncharacterized protein YbjT (DUF2867 family) [Saliterribacillus persicus]